MIFVNETKNTISLDDIGQTIPYLEDESQELSTDNVLRSQLFQLLCLSGKFRIVKATDDRIEQNLLRYQRGKLITDDEKIEAVVKGHFYSNTGYGKANRNLVYSLSRAGIRVGIETADGQGTLNQTEIERITRFRRPLGPKAIHIHSMIPSFVGEVDESAYLILNTTVEATTVPQQFVDVCQKFDEIWVTSDFCKKVFEESGVGVPIFVIPNAVDHSLYNEMAKPHLFVPPLKHFVFVSVLSWGYRKGSDVLLKAYLNEFSSSDDVSLLIVTKYLNGCINDVTATDIQKAISECGKGENHAHIARLGRDVPEFEMPRLYKACDCMILPSRGEGFGLPFVEASLCGLPVIGPNHGGQTMFMTNDNAYLFEVDTMGLIDAGVTNIHYWDGQQFPMLTSSQTINDIGRLMRTVKDDYSVAKTKNKNLQQKLSQFSLEDVGHLAAERLREIWQNH